MVAVTLAIFASIGAIVVAALAYVVTREAIRAIRQGLRVASAQARLNGHRRPTIALWWRAVRYEFDSAYSWLEIGPYRIPRNPNAPITRAIRFHGA